MSSPIAVQYGAMNLQAGGITVVTTDVYSPPANDVQADELPESDGAIVVKQRYKSKTFTVSGRFTTDTIVDSDVLVDALKLGLGTPNQAFDIDYAGGTRRYLATAQNVVISRPNGLPHGGWSCQFLSPDGMGWDVSTTALLTPMTITASNSTLPITVGGTYRSDPLITLTVNSLTIGTGGTITITNSSTLRGMAITRVWIPTDRLEIDSLKKTVFVNDVATEFEGQWPFWDVGVSGISYLDDFTARNVTIEAEHTQRWL